MSQKIRLMVELNIGTPKQVLNKYFQCIPSNDTLYTENRISNSCVKMYKVLIKFTKHCPNTVHWMLSFLVDALLWRYTMIMMMTSSNGNIFRVTGPLLGNSPVPGEFPSQRPVTRSFMFSLICVWINSWINNSEAGDLRRYRVHYDVIVMRASYRLK